MEKALFTGWTENQLRAAFTTANAEIRTLRELAHDPEFWQQVAYIAMLCGERNESPVA